MSCAGNCYWGHVGVSIGNITTGSLFSRLGVGVDDGLFCIFIHSVCWFGSVPE